MDPVRATTPLARPPLDPAPQQPEVETAATAPAADPPPAPGWLQFLEQAFGGEGFDANALADREHGLPQPGPVGENTPQLEPDDARGAEIQAALQGLAERLEARQNEFMERMEQVLEEVLATLPKRDEPYVTRNKPQAPPQDARGRRKPVQSCYPADPPCPCHSSWLPAAMAFAATAWCWVAPLMVLAVLL